MAAFAHLRREEKLGLGIAVALHVALVGALLVGSWRSPPKIPPAQRMTVSLASDVSLNSSAPKPSKASQAAVAPVLAPESAPLPAPTSVPVPAPVEPTVDRSPPKPAQIHAPAPKQTGAPEKHEKAAPPPPADKKAGGSRLGPNFLKGISSDQSASPSAPAASFGPDEAASLRDAVNRQLKPYWRAPEGLDIDKLDTTLTWDLNPDGSLKGTPRLVSQTGKDALNQPQQERHVEQAIRAVELAAPFKLPAQYYDHWKRLTWHFDRNLSE